jgi:hypothetical protein
MGLKLLPALRVRLVEDPHAALAWVPGRNFTPSATSTGPKARAIAAGTLGVLVSETLDKHRGANDHLLKSTVQSRILGSSQYQAVHQVQQQASNYRLGGASSASKRGDLVPFVAPLCIKGLRLATVQLREKSRPLKLGLNRTSPVRGSQKFAYSVLLGSPVPSVSLDVRGGLLARDPALRATHPRSVL